MYVFVLFLYVVVLFSRHTAKLYSNTAFVYGFTAILYRNTENPYSNTAFLYSNTANLYSFSGGGVSRKERKPRYCRGFPFPWGVPLCSFPLEGSCFLCPPCPLGSLALDIPVIEKLDIEYTRVFAAFELVEIYKRLYKVSSRRYVLVA